MKNSGKAILLYILSLFAFTSSLLSHNVEFLLNGNTLQIGEILILDVVLNGTGEMKPIERRYDFKDVQVYYIGDSFETQIINFKVTKRQILKYQVSSNQLGRHKIPKIRVSVDNQVIESTEMYFDVIAKSKPQKLQPPTNLFDQFFGDPSLPEEGYSQPEVAFHTSKKVCYLGEPIVGYYVLYYNGLKQPFLERDPNQSISFPFFLTETLSQVTVQIDPTVNRNGFSRNTLVYLKEIYGLTPMKVGNYSVGATNFIVGDSLRFGGSNEIIPVNKGLVSVLPLPNGAPAKFNGAIGEYDISLHTKPKDVYLGETYYFSVRVFGSGAGLGIEDPLDLKQAKHKDEFFLLKKEKSKVFRKLPEGEYGFYSVVEFFYSFQSKVEGRREIPIAAISYFSPKNNSYTKKNTSPFEIFIRPKREYVSSNKVEKPKEKNGLWKIVLGMFAGAIFFFMIFFGIKRYIHQNQIRESMERLNEKLGSKKGDILKDYLLRHRIPEREAATVAELSLAFPNQSWAKIFNYCSKVDRQMLVTISKNLLN